jgi:hypothetical protein
LASAGSTSSLHSAVRVLAMRGISRVEWVALAGLGLLCVVVALLG